MIPQGPAAADEIETALVTERDSALGDAIAVSLAEHGFELVDRGLARSDDPATRRENAGSTPNRDLEKLGSSVDALVVVSAESGQADERLRLLDIEQEAWSSMLALRVGGVLEALDACIPAMARRGNGKIVIVAESREPAARNIHAAAARGALLGLSRSLALELGPLGLQVNAVLPRTGRGGGEQEAAEAVAFVLAEGSYFCGQVIETVAGSA